MMAVRIFLVGIHHREWRLVTWHHITPSHDIVSFRLHGIALPSNSIVLVRCKLYLIRHYKKMGFSIAKKQYNIILKLAALIDISSINCTQKNIFQNSLDPQPRQVGKTLSTKLLGQGLNPSDACLYGMFPRGVASIPYIRSVTNIKVKQNNQLLTCLVRFLFVWHKFTVPTYFYLRKGSLSESINQMCIVNKSKPKSDNIICKRYLKYQRWN